MKHCFAVACPHGGMVHSLQPSTSVCFKAPAHPTPRPAPHETTHRCARSTKVAAPRPGERGLPLPPPMASCCLNTVSASSRSSASCDSKAGRTSACAEEAGTDGWVKVAALLDVVQPSS